MGFRTTWVAAEDMSAEDMLAHFGLVPHDHELEMIDDTGTYVFRRAPWTFLLADGSDYYMDLEPGQAAACSMGRRVLYLQVNETVMQSILRCYRDGEEVWSVIKEGGAPSEPRVSGTPPPELAGILDDLRAKQAGESDVDHWFDAPVVLGERLTGHRHNKIVDGGGIYLAILP